METGSPGVPALGVAGWGEEMIAARQTLEGSLETKSADVMSNSTTSSLPRSKKHRKQVKLTPVIHSLQHVISSSQ